MSIGDFGCGHCILPFLSFDQESLTQALMWVNAQPYSSFRGGTGAEGDRTEPGIPQ
jgi:hypothetical protein